MTPAMMSPTQNILSVVSRSLKSSTPTNMHDYTAQPCPDQSNAPMQRRDRGAEGADHAEFYLSSTPMATEAAVPAPDQVA